MCRVNKVVLIFKYTFIESIPFAIFINHLTFVAIFHFFFYQPRDLTLLIFIRMYLSQQKKIHSIHLVFIGNNKKMLTNNNVYMN